MVTAKSIYLVLFSFVSRNILLRLVSIPVLAVNAVNPRQKRPNDFPRPHTKLVAELEIEPRPQDPSPGALSTRHAA